MSEQAGKQPHNRLSLCLFASRSRPNGSIGQMTRSVFTRTVQIGWVFLRHALTAFVHFVRSRFLHIHRGGPGQGAPEHLRDALLELGPTFIKLGQVLSTRPDLIPPTYEEALSSLQDSAPPIPFDAVRDVISHELSRDPAEAYAYIGEEPIAVASIGQVHAARLFDGREIVVKVRRPGIIPTVESDLAILHVMAKLAIFGRRRSVVLGFIDEFAMTLRTELDYVAEGESADRIRPGLTAIGVHIPMVIWELTTSGMLTLERVCGTKITDFALLEEMGVDRRVVARDLAYAYLKMVFTDGFFHADPHPGNLFVEADGRLAMVDFGMMGTVTASVRAALVEILLALATKDSMRSSAALRALGVVPSDVDEVRFAAELERLISASVELPAGEMRVAPLLVDFMAVSRRHHLRFPRELGLLVKTVVMCEGLAARLDPSFALLALLPKFLQSTFRPGLT
jgi:ubiquinone biosynthesis protein